MPHGSPLGVPVASSASHACTADRARAKAMADRINAIALHDLPTNRLAPLGPCAMQVRTRAAAVADAPTKAPMPAGVELYVLHWHDKQVTASSDQTVLEQLRSELKRMEKVRREPGRGGKGWGRYQHTQHNWLASAASGMTAPCLQAQAKTTVPSGRRAACHGEGVSGTSCAAHMRNPEAVRLAAQHPVPAPPLGVGRECSIHMASNPSCVGILDQPCALPSH